MQGWERGALRGVGKRAGHLASGVSHSVVIVVSHTELQFVPYPVCFMSTIQITLYIPCSHPFPYIYLPLSIHFSLFFSTLFSLHSFCLSPFCSPISHPLYFLAFPPFHFNLSFLHSLTQYYCFFCHASSRIIRTAVVNLPLPPHFMEE